MADEFAKNWEEALARGYEPVPITPGTKACHAKGWTGGEITRERCQAWTTNGHAHDGLGLRTGSVVLFDGDIFDKPVLSEIVKRIQYKLGKGLTRIGNSPKRGLVFRADRPFPRMASREYRDSKGRKAQLEVLAQGRQFVADAVHPYTGKPYRWLGDSYLTISADELLVVTEEDARWACDQFEELAQAAGWEPWEKENASRSRITITSDEADDLHNATLEERVDGVGLDDLVGTLTYLDPGVGRDAWLRILQGCHHQFGDDAKVILDEWSQRAPDKYNLPNTTTFDEVWESLGKPRKGRPITFRSVMDTAKEHGWRGCKRSGPPRRARSRLWPGTARQPVGRLPPLTLRY